jgi:hypothetical protein
MKSWLLLFLVFLFLILLYSLRSAKISYTSFAAKPVEEEKNNSGWYVLGKVQIENGKIVSIAIPG